MTDNSLKNPSFSDEKIKQIQERLAKTDKITASHIKNINSELELLYLDLVEHIPESNRSELREILLKSAYELHEKIKNCYV